MPRYILGIDQGTSLTTALLIDEQWQVVSRGQREHRQIYPQPGWVEHDPVEILECVLGAVYDAINGIGASANEIMCIGIDHQGETCLVWDKKTGIPIYNAIVWQDRRTTEFTEKLKREHGEYIHRITGVMPDSYYSVTKIKWILDNIPDARERANRGELLAGTINTWIIWKLTGGKAFVTDGCSGGRWMLMDLSTTQWDETIAGLADVPLSILPPLLDCNAIYGYTEPEMFWGAKIPISGCLSDGHAALLGSGSVAAGTLKTSYGTGSFMLLATGERFIISKHGLTTSSSWKISGVPHYALLGATFVAGAAIQWLRDGLRFIDTADQVEQLATSVPDTLDVYFVPAFVGLATPHWDQYARGAFLGLTGGVKREHLARAVLESVAFETTDCYRAMKREYQGDINSMLADGGMVDNEFLMQLQADLLGIPVVIPHEKECAAYGAACMGALTMGALSSLDDVKRYVKIKKVYNPLMSEDERETRMKKWQRAVERSKGWAKE